MRLARSSAEGGREWFAAQHIRLRLILCVDGAGTREPRPSPLPDATGIEPSLPVQGLEICGAHAESGCQFARDDKPVTLATGSCDRMRASWSRFPSARRQLRSRTQLCVFPPAATLTSRKETERAGRGSPALRSFPVRCRRSLRRPRRPVERWRRSATPWRWRPTWCRRRAHGPVRNRRRCFYPS